MLQTNNITLESVLIQPTIDLIAHIDKQDVARILVYGGIQQDINLLQNRFPEAEILYLEPLSSLSELGSFDLIFSNDVIQNLSFHNRLITSLFNLLNTNGLLAVQTPYCLNMPIQLMLENLAEDKRWAHFFKDIIVHYFTPAYYYEILSTLSADLIMWETNYYASFFQYEEIVHLYAQTEMKKYLQALPDDEKRELFQALLVDLMPAEYKKQSNQAILFPYRRNFFVAKK